LTSRPMVEIIFNTIAVIGFLLLLIFAWIGFKFVAKAFSFAAELQLLEYKYEKIKGIKDGDAMAKAIDKFTNDKA